MGDIRRRAAVVLGVTGLVAPLAVALGAAPAQAASCTTQTGPYQKKVEKFLGRQPVIRVRGRSRGRISVGRRPRGPTSKRFDIAVVWRPRGSTSPWTGCR